MFSLYPRMSSDHAERFVIFLVSYCHRSTTTEVSIYRCVEQNNEQRRIVQRLLCQQFSQGLFLQQEVEITLYLLPSALPFIINVCEASF